VVISTYSDLDPALVYVQSGRKGSAHPASHSTLTCRRPPHSRAAWDYYRWLLHRVGGQSDARGWQTRTPMAKPRIFGEVFRWATLTRAIRSGEALLAQTEGVRRRMKLVEGSRLDELAIEEE